MISLAAGGGQRGRRGRLESPAKCQQGRVGVIAHWTEGLHLTHPSHAIRAYTAARGHFSVRIYRLRRTTTTTSCFPPLFIRRCDPALSVVNKPIPSMPDTAPDTASLTYWSGLGHPLPRNNGQRTVTVPPVVSQVWARFCRYPNAHSNPPKPPRCMCDGL